MIAPSIRVAGAPITWGVCEVPGWGCQLDADRVLGEVADLGLQAVELGPSGFLPSDPALVARALRRHDLRLAAGFVPVLLHRPEVRAEAVATVTEAARTLAAAGADVLVLAATLGDREDGYDRSSDLSEPEWTALLGGLDQVREAAARGGMPVALHPHYGTAVERGDHIARILERSDVPLCLDTGHLLVAGADPLEILRAADGRVSHVHFKDVDAALADRVRRGEIGYRDAVALGLYRPLGDGDVDLRSIVALLQAAGYGGWYVLEQDVVLESEPRPGEGPVRDAARSLHFLMEIMHR